MSACISAKSWIVERSSSGVGKPDDKINSF